MNKVLDLVGVTRSSWYYKPVAVEKKKNTGFPQAKPIDSDIEETVLSTAMSCPWCGYKKIAVIVHRSGIQASNRIVCRVMKRHSLLKKRSRNREALFIKPQNFMSFCPVAPNELWQMDVTYIHIPGCGWWHAVTVIDYYSRYLLAAYLTRSYSTTEVIESLKKGRKKGERIHGPFKQEPFLGRGNGNSFIFRRFG